MTPPDSMDRVLRLIPSRITIEPMTALEEIPARVTRRRERPSPRPHSIPLSLKYAENRCRGETASVLLSARNNEPGPMLHLAVDFGSAAGAISCAAQAAWADGKGGSITSSP